MWWYLLLKWKRRSPESGGGVRYFYQNDWKFLVGQILDDLIYYSIYWFQEAYHRLEVILPFLLSLNSEAEGGDIIRAIERHFIRFLLVQNS